MPPLKRPASGGFPLFLDPDEDAPNVPEAAGSGGLTKTQ